MKMDSELFDRIKRYVLGQMTAGERAEFERDIEADEDLRKEYMLVTLVSDELKRAGVRDTLLQAQAEYNEAEHAIDPEELEKRIAEVDADLAELGKKSGLFSKLIEWFSPSGFKYDTHRFIRSYYNRIATSLVTAAAALVAVRRTL